MTKTDLVREIALKSGKSIADSKEFTNIFIQTLLDCVRAEGSVHIPAFGNFAIIDRAERHGVHPLTKKQIITPAKRVFKFKASKALEV